MDVCNVCGGFGLPQGACNCEGDTLDRCGKCGFDGQSCSASYYSKAFTLCTPPGSRALATLYRDDPSFRKDRDVYGTFLDYCAYSCDLNPECTVFIINDGGRSAAVSGTNTIDWCVLKTSYDQRIATSAGANPHWDCYFRPPQAPTGVREVRPKKID